MTYTTVCVLLAILGLSSAASYSYPRGCIYANGRCVQECPVGTVSYTVDCGYVTREATCRDSRPKADKHQTCGYSACHCVYPTVRNEVSGQCVHLDKCPNAKIIHGHGHGGVPKIQRRPLTHKLAPRHQNPQAQVAPPTAPQVVYPKAPQAPQVAPPAAPQVVIPKAPQVVQPTAPQVVYPQAPQVVIPKAPQVVQPTAPQVVYPQAPQVAHAVPTYNNANNGYTNYNSGYENYNSGYTNTNSGYANNAVPLAARV